jgi:cell division protein FtsI/penicillin-binding protein 2
MLKLLVAIRSTPVLFLLWSGYAPGAHAEQPHLCSPALKNHSVCEAGNAFLEEQITKRHLAATSVVQDVRTGALVAFASSPGLDPSTSILPLSFAKVYLAASWWDRRLPDQRFRARVRNDKDPNPAFRKSVDLRSILIGGSDSAGEQLAVALRRTVGESSVVEDLDRFGFGTRGDSFWANIDPDWSGHLVPADPSLSVAGLDDQAWGEALSIGETHMRTTPLAISSFLQAVGNHGIACAPFAKAYGRGERSQSWVLLCRSPKRLLRAQAAEQIQGAMVETVQHGTADRIANSMSGTGWSIGGKTGTGGHAGASLDRQDGLFAGLILDQHGDARFTIVTLVREGGIGGGRAAELSAEIARLLAMSQNTQ